MMGPARASLPLVQKRRSVQAALPALLERTTASLVHPEKPESLADSINRTAPRGRRQRWRFPVERLGNEPGKDGTVRAETAEKIGSTPGPADR